MSIDNFVRKNRHLGFKPKTYFRSEGEEGIKNLARLCSGLGYTDEMHFGLFEGGCCYGDLINFLENNPGAVEAMLEWIEENYESELESDSDETPEDNDLEEYDEDDDSEEEEEEDD